jgi:hypothetical protein
MSSQSLFWFLFRKSVPGRDAMDSKGRVVSRASDALLAQIAGFAW